MTQNELKIYGERFFEDTCYKVQAEIVRKIMNCKSISDFEKMKFLKQYLENRTTNKNVIDSIKRLNKLKYRGL